MRSSSLSSRRLLTIAAVVALLASPSATLAQDPVLDLELELEQEHEDAAYVRDVGAGLFLSGLALTGGGTGIMLGIDGGFEGWGHVIGGGLLTGIGGVLGLVGLPTWIAGGVRADVLSASSSLARARAGREWQSAGIAIFATGMGLTTLAAVVMAFAVGLRNTPDEVVLTSVVMIPVGSFVALFIGAPMWAEGARF